ncbi:hypothetical protein E1264_03340 [Actinomadura sp. KC216]|uniref:hypothetical protein n=1 Tax=Actinomadura sp. KC216 TaxID=2530370 RepID=UPI0010495C25|nr:hypothetical protein [Actinomadura sp. KC216]TDB90873.1 hypothetical protein E1264_03340 [Actinomadura sp. KC216]
MVIVDQKFNMPVGSLVEDVDYPQDGVFRITERPHTTAYGTEVGVVNAAGRRFTDYAIFFKPLAR